MQIYSDAGVDASATILIRWGVRRLATCLIIRAAV